MADLTTHLCPRCNEAKILTEFAGRKNSAGLPYRSSYCRACQSEYNRQWRVKNGATELARRQAKYESDPAYRAKIKADNARRWAENPDPQRNAYLLAKFGISLEDYRRMSVAQESLCAICGETCPTGRSLAVDHDHATGRVRGLLCSRCNNGLGNFRDSLGLLAAAAEYLGGIMPTHYVEDYDGKRNKDAVDPAPSEVAATPVDEPEAKVVEAPAKSAPKKSAAKVTTKG